MEKKTESTEKPNTKKTVTTAADAIWEDIKNTPLELFALPGQVVHMFFSPVNIDPEKLYLTVTAPAAFPAMEAALGNKYNFERVDRFITVTRK